MPLLSSRIRLSLAYGLPRVYRRILARIHLSPVGPKEVLDLTLVMFGGREHLPLIRESLASLQAHWAGSPRLHLVSDGSLDASSAAEIISWWPAPARLSDWSAVAEDIAARGEVGRLLARFARREVMGRKLVSIVAGAASGPTLYTDADVLWFDDLQRLGGLDWRDGKPAALKVSQDTQRSYDDRLVPEALPGLADGPALCAGFLMAEGDLLEACELQQVLEFAAREGVGVSEQTIVAEMARQLGGSSWPLSLVESRFDDRYRVTPSFPKARWVARHYLAPARHLFWHDAFHLRLGLARSR